MTLLVGIDIGAAGHSAAYWHRGDARVAQIVYGITRAPSRLWSATDGDETSLLADLWSSSQLSPVDGSVCLGAPIRFLGMATSRVRHGAGEIAIDPPALLSHSIHGMLEKITEVERDDPVEMIAVAVAGGPTPLLKEYLQSCASLLGVREVIAVPVTEALVAFARAHLVGACPPDAVVALIDWGVSSCRVVVVDGIGRDAPRIVAGVEVPDIGGRRIDAAIVAEVLRRRESSTGKPVDVTTLPEADIAQAREVAVALRAKLSAAGPAPTETIPFRWSDRTTHMESFDSAWFDSLRPHGNAERLSVEDRLHELLAIVQVAAGDEGLDAVLLVGGYAGMPHLARAIARACGPGCNIVVPDDPSAALAEGVVRAAAARTGAPGAPAEVALRVDMLDDEIRLLVGLDQAVTLVPRGSPLGRSFTTRRQFVPQGETTPIARIVLGDDLRTPRLASLRLGPKYAGRPTSVTTRVESLAMTDDQLTGNLEISFEAPDARLGPVRISIDRTLAKIR